jgi:hypothetical protein
MGRILLRNVQTLQSVMVLVKMTKLEDKCNYPKGTVRTRGEGILMRFVIS